VLDLYLASALVLTLAIGLGFVSAALATKSRAAACILIIVSVIALALHVAFGRHTLWPARFLPWSALIILAEPSPLLVGIITGAGSRLLPGHLIRRCLLLAPLIALCLWTTFSPIFKSPPPTDNQWEGRVCLQTFQSSCAPAAGATLLRAFGILSSETEMARLSLTTHDGTKSRGLWRGLSLKTTGTKFKPIPYFGDLESLRTAPMPMILMMRLDPKKPHDPRYHTKWGWVPNVPHTVVLFRITRDGRYVIGDPSVGIEFWHRDALETLWHGEGISIVPR
jgi:hypothetical protein